VYRYEVYLQLYKHSYSYMSVW